MKLSEFYFRIWDYKRKTFINYQCQMSFVFNNERNKENYLKVMDCFDNKNPKNNEFYGLKSYNSNDIEIELWTGIYDKFGDKIYEGDIVKYCDFENLVIKFVDGVFIASRSYNEFIKKIKHGYNEEEVKNTLFKSSYKLYKQVFDEKMCDNLKIIGNIHENPEFLKC
ncbi:hypothetical protein KJQ78_03840 [Campylobacter lari]|uniref:YopX family protein n=1 Tax=Campylobacter lari TaxID=201 RepID=UPI00128031B5|nr:YopX family protein [Campylobacter lari]MBT0824391.1 hypothetical protein [Campylobacter lari]